MLARLVRNVGFYAYFVLVLKIHLDTDRRIGSYQSHITNYIWRFSTKFSFSLYKNACGRLQRDILDPWLSEIGWMQEIQCINASCHRCYGLKWLVSLKTRTFHKLSEHDEMYGNLENRKGGHQYKEWMLLLLLLQLLCHDSPHSTMHKPNPPTLVVGLYWIMNNGLWKLEINC